ncbi:MAG: hypothetical protein P3W94_001430 [Paracoccus sp. (in: a-proteobacteria)]|nr:hypothetical protein [Paracoccus sp. (in: a-proteobacteria)]
MREDASQSLHEQLQAFLEAGLLSQEEYDEALLALTLRQPGHLIPQRHDPESKKLRHQW